MRVVRRLLTGVLVAGLSFAMVACNEQQPQLQTQTVTNPDGTTSQVQVPVTPQANTTVRDGFIGAAIGYFLGRATAPGGGVQAGHGGYSGVPQGGIGAGTTTVNKTVNQTIINKTYVQKPVPKDVKPTIPGVPPAKTHPQTGMPVQRVTPTLKQQAQAYRAQQQVRTTPSAPRASSGSRR